MNARARVADVQGQLSGSDSGLRISSLCLLNTDIGTLDFEEHLGHGLGKNATDALKFRLWLCIVKKEDLKWKWKKQMCYNNSMLYEQC